MADRVVRPHARAHRSGVKQPGNQSTMRGSTTPTSRIPTAGWNTGEGKGSSRPVRG